MQFFQIFAQMNPIQQIIGISPSKHILNYQNLHGFVTVFPTQDDMKSLAA